MSLNMFIMLLVNTFATSSTFRFTKASDSFDFCGVKLSDPRHSIKN